MRIIENEEPSQETVDIEQLRSLVDAEDWAGFHSYIQCDMAEANGEYAVREIDVPASQAPLPSLNGSELATILHALRMLQENEQADGPTACHSSQCDHFYDAEELSLEQIDALCERLNEEVDCVNATPHELKPKIVIAVEGGLVSSIVSSIALDCAVIDYDTEGADEGEIFPVPQGEGNQPADGCGHLEKSEVNPARTAELYAAVQRGKGTTCSEAECGAIVRPEDPYFATPCGTFCEEHMRAHVKQCEICASQFELA